MPLTNCSSMAFEVLVCISISFATIRSKIGEYGSKTESQGCKDWLVLEKDEIEINFLVLVSKSITCLNVEMITVRGLYISSYC